MKAKKVNPTQRQGCSLLKVAWSPHEVLLEYFADSPANSLTSTPKMDSWGRQTCFNFFSSALIVVGTSATFKDTQGSH